MEPATSRKKHQQPPEEFKRFEELTKKLVSVPKKDVQEEEKKFKKSQEKARKR